MIKLKLQLPNGTIRRTRLTDSYAAWKWCSEAAAGGPISGDNDLVFEETVSGIALRTPLDFARLFSEVLQRSPTPTMTTTTEADYADDDVLIRIAAVPMRKASFRLARDLPQDVHSATSRAASKEAFRLAGDDFQFKEPASIKPKEFDYLDASSPPSVVGSSSTSRAFTLARDSQCDDLLESLERRNSQPFQLTQDEDPSKVLPAYKYL